MSEQAANVVNVEELEEIQRTMGDHWGAAYKILTPSMKPRGGKLGVNLMRVSAGRTVCPYHSHRKEDEVFYILSGRGLLRYGEETREIQAGDCISCPAGTGIAHQIANVLDEDLVYLAIGNHEPDEVCVYPDNGKILVRGIGKLGRITEAGYLDGEPEPPKIFANR